jgi:hypothetical protein
VTTESSAPFAPAGPVPDVVIFAGLMNRIRADVGVNRIPA